MSKTIRIGTRGSKLALAQAKLVSDALETSFPNLKTEFVIIKSTGDLITDRPLSQIGETGVFTNALEAALEQNTIDLAVHSMKDLPSTLKESFILAPSPLRADPRDALILKNGFSSLAELPKFAKIGTGSPRRAMQLLALRPDITVIPIRGNIDSRLFNVETEFDGIILASAGLSRLGLSDRVTQYFTPEEMLPAPCQGILGLETRITETELIKQLSITGDSDTTVSASAERAFLQATHAGCHTPVGAFCRCSGDFITLYGMFGETDKSFVKGSLSGKRTEAEKIGHKLAQNLLDCYKENKN